MKLGIASLLAALALGAAPDASFAQEEDGGFTSGCGTYNAGVCDPGWHAVPVEGTGYYNRQHSDCKQCYDRSLGQFVSGDQCHESTCSSPSALTQITLTAYNMVLDAVRTGDAHRLISLAPMTGGLVAYNRSRQAIQIGAPCRGGIVASIPLAARDVALASRLPDVGVLLQVTQASHEKLRAQREDQIAKELTNPLFGIISTDAARLMLP